MTLLVASASHKTAQSLLFLPRESRLSLGLNPEPSIILLTRLWQRFWHAQVLAFPALLRGRPIEKFYNCTERPSFSYVFVSRCGKSPCCRIVTSRAMVRSVQVIHCEKELTVYSIRNSPLLRVCLPIPFTSSKLLLNSQDEMIVGQLYASIYFFFDWTPLR